MNVIKDFERISDHCENLCEFLKAIDRNEKFCEPAVEEIGSMLQLAISIVEDALRVIQLVVALSVRLFMIKKQKWTNLKGIS